MAAARLALPRDRILAHRRRVAALDERLPPGAASLRQAAWAGLSDSMPRAALLSIHARVAGTGPSAWEDPSLVQVWGPRWSAYVVPERDRAFFTLGRLPESPARRRYMEGIANDLETFLAGRRLEYAAVGRELGVRPNELRYAAPTGRLLIRWDGARRPTIWTVPRPAIDPADARNELARRFLHVFGPGMPTSFGDWAGVKPRAAQAAFDAIDASLMLVRTPIGDAWILTDDESSFRAPTGSPSAVRFLPSGDTWFLLQGAERELLIPDEAHRSKLWTSRVWPGAVLVDGDVAGTWRRAGALVTIEPWRRLPPGDRRRIVAEAESLPLPDIGAIRVDIRLD